MNTYPIPKELGAAQLLFVTEIVLKSPLLRVNRARIRYACFRAGAKVRRYSMKIALTERLLFLGILALI